MSTQKTEWTKQQARAIGARGSDVLVTASAGTGKTAVLSGRCVQIVSDPSICPDILSVLVLTFTEAAAQQMQTRIAQQLRRAGGRKSDSHVARQLVLLQGAEISTIHSFCKRLITEYFHKLDLDPTFAVLDSDQAALLKAEALDRTIEWAWQQSHLSQPMQLLLRGRDPDVKGKFIGTIVRLSDFLDSVVRPDQWLDRSDTLVAGLADSQRDTVTETLQSVKDQLEYALDLYNGYAPQGDWASRFEAEFIKPVDQWLGLTQSGDWAQFADSLAEFLQHKPRFKKPKDDVGEMVAQVLADIKSQAMTTLESLTAFAVLNPDYVDKVAGAVSLQSRVLAELVRCFRRFYDSAKTQINGLDFADLEHQALRLLTTPAEDDDAPSPSETALALRQRFKHIFVDEYQDINPVQQAILQALSARDNLFVVGDVKQSIYAWRGAEPSIFLGRLAGASDAADPAASGLRVDLNTNFRSAKGILDFVNAVFSRIMTPALGQIDYDESASLKPPSADGQAGSSPGAGQPCVELHIIDQAAADGESDEPGPEIPDDPGESGQVSHRRRQAALLARRIRQLVGADTGKAEMQLYDKEQQCVRDVQYGDIVVLLRSLAGKANDYVEIFRLAGIPVSSDATAGYFEATEITDILSLLKVLDNPLRDIEFAAVLRSPFFAVRDAQLAEIRLFGRTQDTNVSFHDCVSAYAANGPNRDTRRRLNDILAQLDRWRTMARRAGLADLLWQIYRETNALAFVSALPNGRARKANLLKLHDRAIQLGSFAGGPGAASLARFVEFLEKLLETGQDWSPAQPRSAAGNAVRILSVHKSKGLEFPVVILGELESRFNKRDTLSDVIADSGSTFGLQIVDHDSGVKLPSLAHQVIAEKKIAQGLAEEMRILYVAMTRASQRLILTASAKAKKCRDIISKGFHFGGAIPHWQLSSSQNMLEWILYALSDQPALHESLSTGLCEQTTEPGLFSSSLHDQAKVKQLSDFVLQLRGAKLRRRPRRRPKQDSKRRTTPVFAQVKGALSWRYPYADAVQMPAKSSVTELTHRGDQYARLDYSRALDRRPIVLARAEVGAAGPSHARLLGTATHLLIASLDLTGPADQPAIVKTIEQLVADDCLDARLPEQIDTSAVAAFFDSDLGRLALDPANQVKTEWPFTYALAARDYAALTGGQIACDESVVVQGIVDMLIRADQGLIVIDFKTDRVSREQISERAGLYSSQLRIYSQAASAILRADVAARWLYFLAPRRAIEV